MSYATEVLTDSPLAWFRLGEASGSAVDHTLNANQFSYVGGCTRAVAGALGASGDTDGAVTFDGTTGYVSGSDTALQFTGAFTLEAWIKTTTTATAVVIDSLDGATNNGYMWLINLPGGGPGKLSLWDTTAWRGPSNTAVNDGNWHHIAIVHDGAGHATFYLDGVADGTVTSTNPTASGQPINIGAHHNSSGTSDFLDATVDEVAFYSTALSVTRLAAHHTAASTVPPGITVPFTDPFNYPDGWLDHQGPWLATLGRTDSGFGPDLVVVTTDTSKVLDGGGGSGMGVCNYDFPSYSMAAQIDIVGLSGLHADTVVVSFDKTSTAGNLSFIQGGYDHSLGQWHIHGVLNGGTVSSGTVFATLSASAPTVPYTLKLQNIGGQLTLYCNGVQVLTATDSLGVHGTRGGFAGGSSNTSFDNFVLTTAVVGPFCGVNMIRIN